MKANDDDYKLNKKGKYIHLNDEYMVLSNKQNELVSITHKFDLPDIQRHFCWGKEQVNSLYKSLADNVNDNLET